MSEGKSPDIARCEGLRREIKTVAEKVDAFRKAGISFGIEGLPTDDAGFQAAGEARDNITLAYRHLEDASMRLGKAIQALDGGVSVYDKGDRTQVVGA